MPRRHRMRFRREGGHCLTSIPPTLASAGRTVNFSVDWAEPEILDPANLFAHMSLHLPDSTSEPSGSSLCLRKRPCKSTISPIPAFALRNMNALTIQSTSSSDHDSSSSDEGGTCAGADNHAASSVSSDDHALFLPLSTAHASKQEEDESNYACRIVEEPLQPSEKNDSCPFA